jgi:nuclear pore complex protein Nup205
MFYLIGSAIGRKQEDLFHDLEIVLRRHKPDFIGLLQNPAMNSSHRDQVKKSVEEGLQLSGETRRQKLPAQFIEEALLLSELVKLNEFSAIELLLQGEEHQPRHPGLTRGLVAVLLYHEERKCLVSCLRSLIQAREGASWTLGLSDEMNQLITSFTDELLQSGLTEKILSLLASLHVETELSALEKGRGVGGIKHRQQIISLVTEQRIILADCLFCWACQNPLPKADVFSVMKFLKKLTQDQLLVEDGTLDPVYLSLLMTVLYSLNAEPLSEVDIDDTDEFYDSLHMFQDKKWIGEFHEELLGDGSFKCKEMAAVIMLAWSLVVNIAGKRSNMTAVVDDLKEDDEQLFDQAIAGGALKFLQHAIVLSPAFSEEEYYIRRIHSLVTGLLVNMPQRVKKLRNENDETARIITLHIQQGVEPREGLRHDFEDLMRLIGEIYMNDALKLQLEVEYWGPSEPSLSHSVGGNTSVAYQHQTSQRQVSLYKFVRLAGDLLPSSLFTPYLNMLFGLSNSPVAAHHCYNMLKANSASLGAGTASSNVSWDHFFLSMKQYYLSMKQDAAVIGMAIMVHL